MLKKIIIGVVMFGLAGLLVYGAVNRTTAKLSTPRANGVQVYDDYSGGNRGENSNNSLDGIIDLPWDSTDIDDTPRSGGGQGKNSKANRSDSYSTSTSVQDWQSLTGTVVVADNTRLQIETEGGEIIQPTYSAWDYALSQGFVIEEGDPVEMWGFYDADQYYEICCLTNGGSGQSITLRDDSGYPMWSGRGGNSRSGRRNL